MNPIRVIKIGGSLLQRDNLLADLRDWQESLVEPLGNVWVVGGGAAVEAIRQRDSHDGLSDDDAHWLSIEAMDANAFTLASQMPAWQLITPKDLKEAQRRLSPRERIATSAAPKATPPNQNLVLQTKHWLTKADRDPNTRPRLPHCWDVTSDSIAAWAAIQLHATELVLLKSCDVPDETIAELAGLRIVDPFLPSLNLHRQTFRFTCLQLPHAIK